MERNGHDVAQVVIIGAGAMGCLFGGLLHEAGYAVRLVAARQETVREINTSGIVIESGGGVRHIGGLVATADYSTIAGATLVLVFVKAAATGAAASAAAPYLSRDALVLTLQNGLGNIEALCGHFPPEMVAAGTTGSGASSVAPGRILLAGIGETVLGELDGRASKRLERVCAMLTASGLPARLSVDIAGTVWAKLLANVGINAVAALTGLKNGDIFTHVEAAEIAAKAVLEAAAVAEASGVLTGVVDPVAHVRGVAEQTAANDASMLQDIRAKRMTEIDAINGEVARRGAALGVATPVNSLLTALVRLRQKGYLNL